MGREVGYTDHEFPREMRTTDINSLRLEEGAPGVAQCLNLSVSAADGDNQDMPYEARGRIRKDCERALAENRGN